MRKIMLLSFALLPGLTAAADERIVGVAAEKLTAELHQTICKTLRSGDATCAVSIESATHHQLGAGQSLWAFAWKANTPFRLKNEAENTMRDALEKKQVQVLDVFPGYFIGITYFRQQGTSLEQLSSAGFSMVALNTTTKAVARIAPGLFRGRDPDYVLPEKWQNEGLSPADRGAITLTLPASGVKLAVSLRDLDDAPLSGIKIDSCTLISGNKETECNPGEIGPFNTSASIKLQLVAEKKLKTSQPAFKLVLQEAGTAKFLLHLAIPYRPGPNYLVFGVAGFLFGGLIAVMVLFLRRKPAAGTRP
ncbi:MAG: hypothetical protein ACOY5B_03485 [Spirochaetota bacterium]